MKNSESNAPEKKVAVRLKKKMKQCQSDTHKKICSAVDTFLKAYETCTTVTGVCELYKNVHVFLQATIGQIDTPRNNDEICAQLYVLYLKVNKSCNKTDRVDGKFTKTLKNI